MQSAELADQFVARSQIQMVGIRQQDLYAEVFQVLLRLSLYCGRRSHRHKCRCIDHAMRGAQSPQPRPGRIGGQHFEFETGSLGIFRTRRHPVECIRRTRR